MYNSTTTTTIFDSLGKEHKLDVFFIKGAAANAWTVRALVDGAELTPPINTAITFGTDGQLVTTPTAPFPVTLTWAPAGAAAGSTKLDLKPLTQFSGRFAVSELSQDGYTTGQLTGLKVDGEGIIKAQLSNGQSVLLGQVALAKFRNNIALQPAGNNLWTATASSGLPQLGTPGSDGVGLIESGALEESNVDVTDQLVEMITAQRNFQASVKALQTQDTITQTVINLR
jgi:flagellar hook protein FlgE